MSVRVITGRRYGIETGLEEAPSGPWFVVGRAEIPIRIDQTLDWRGPGTDEPSFSSCRAYLVVPAVQTGGTWSGVAGEVWFLPQFAIESILEEGVPLRPRAVRGWSYENPYTLLEVGDFGLEGVLGDYLISETGPRPSRIDVSMGWRMPLDAEPVFLRVDTGIGWASEEVGGVWTNAMTTPGAGYSTAPAVSFLGGGGSGATAGAWIFGGSLERVEVTSGGSGYTSAPDVVFTGGSPSSPAVAVATVVGGRVVEVSWQSSYEVPLFLLTHVWTWVVDSSGGGGTSGTSGTGGGGGGGTSGTSGTSGDGVLDLEFVPNAGLQFAGTSGTAGTAGTYGTSAVMTIYNTTLDPVTTMVTSVGGIPAGTTADDLNELNMVQLWDRLLFPTLQPTYTIPTIVLSSTITGIREVGITVSPDLAVTAVKATAGAFTFLSINRNSSLISSTSSPTVSGATALPSQYGYPDPNNPNQSYGHTHTDPGVVVPPMSGSSPSAIVYQASGNYGAGLPKRDSKGVLDVRLPAIRSTNAPQAAATGFLSNTQVINGFYPYFYGVTNSQTSAAAVQLIINSGLGLTKVVGDAGGAIQLAYNATAKWLWFATFSGYPSKTEWEELDNPLNKGNIGATGVFPDLFANPVILPCNSSLGYWSNIPYKIYIAQKITDISTCIVRL